MQKTQKLAEFSEEDYCNLKIIQHHLPVVLFQFFHPPSPVRQILSRGHPLWILALQPSVKQLVTGMLGCTNLQLEAAHKNPQNFS